MPGSERHRPADLGLLTLADLLPANSYPTPEPPLTCAHPTPELTATDVCRRRHVRHDALLLVARGVVALPGAAGDPARHPVTSFHPSHQVAHPPPTHCHSPSFAAQHCYRWRRPSAPRTSTPTSPSATCAGTTAAAAPTCARGRAGRRPSTPTAARAAGRRPTCTPTSWDVRSRSRTRGSTLF